jgi:hypothetical protein
VISAFGGVSMRDFFGVIGSIASRVNRVKSRLVSRAEVAELADATDSKSVEVHSSCGFDSHLRHQQHLLN